MTHQAVSHFLREQLRVMREQRLVMLVLILVTAGTAFGFSKLQEKKYESTASVSFREETEDLGLLGAWIVPTIFPFQLAVQQSLTIKRDTVVLGALRRLQDLNLTVKDLRDAELTATVDPLSTLVRVQVRDTDPRRAAAIANAFAAQAASESNAISRRRYERAARDLRRQLRELLPEQGNERFMYTIQLTRLQSLAEFNVSADFVGRATPATSPIYPRTVRNTIFGGIAGLLVGLFAAFLRAALDRRPRSKSDVYASLHLPLLGSVRGAALGRAFGQTRRRRDPVDLETARMIRHNVELLDADGGLRVVAVTSAVAEEGKSTVAASVAVAAATGGRRTLLLECDLRQPSLAERLGAQTGPGLAEVLDGEADVGDVTQLLNVDGGQTSTNGASAPHQLAVITSGEPTPYSADLLASERFSALLQELRDAYDLVVVDTAPLLPVADTLELVPLVDGVVLCVRINRTTLEQAIAARGALERFPWRPMGVVVTGTTAQDEQIYGGYGTRYGYAPRETTPA